MDPIEHSSRGSSAENYTMSPSSMSTGAVEHQQHYSPHPPLPTPISSSADSTAAASIVSADTLTAAQLSSSSSSSQQQPRSISIQQQQYHLHPLSSSPSLPQQLQNQYAIPMRQQQQVRFADLPETMAIPQRVPQPQQPSPLLPQQQQSQSPQQEQSSLLQLSPRMTASSQSPSSTPPPPLYGFIHDGDVLSGRGVSIAQHPGCGRFRALVNSHFDTDYCSEYSTSEKRAVAQEIIAHIHNLDPPGRFLKKATNVSTSSSSSSGNSSGSTATTLRPPPRGKTYYYLPPNSVLRSIRSMEGPWEELTKDEAIRKTCQALRDCNRLDRTGYASAVVIPEDVHINVQQRANTGLSNKERAQLAAAKARSEADDKHQRQLHPQKPKAEEQFYPYSFSGTASPVEGSGTMHAASMILSSSAAISRGVGGTPFKRGDISPSIENAAQWLQSQRSNVSADVSSVAQGSSLSSLFAASAVPRPPFPPAVTVTPNTAIRPTIQNRSLEEDHYRLQSLLSPGLIADTSLSRLPLHQNPQQLLQPYPSSTHFTTPLMNNFLSAATMATNPISTAMASRSLQVEQQPASSSPFHYSAVRASDAAMAAAAAAAMAATVSPTQPQQLTPTLMYHSQQPQQYSPHPSNLRLHYNNNQSSLSLSPSSNIHQYGARVEASPIDARELSASSHLSTHHQSQLDSSTTALINEASGDDYLLEQLQFATEAGVPASFNDPSRRLNALLQLHDQSGESHTQSSSSPHHHQHEQEHSLPDPHSAPPTQSDDSPSSNELRYSPVPFGDYDNPFQDEL